MPYNHSFMKTFKVIGLMSGTSLDGLDLACCEFSREENQWQYQIIAAVTLPYPASWTKALSEAQSFSAFELALLNKDYGHFLGMVVKKYISETGFIPDLVASHGHTIFHKPEQGLTFQLGDGAALAAIAGIPVVCDFRTVDVALGGQGAPLVPAGDKILFEDYTCCLNLGGFSNISYDYEGRRIAHDVSPCNMALNRVASLAGQVYDKEGNLARGGKIIEPLLKQLNDLEYYSLPAPKSLGREWFEEKFLPLLGQGKPDPGDLLRTLTEHIAVQVARSVTRFSSGSLLITGGGAHNQFLVERIKKMVSLDIVIPDPLLIDFKEALIFAFLGVLRYNSQINVFASVTGAKRDHIAGAIYL